jgi:hypothetical protein
VLPPPEGAPRGEITAAASSFTAAASTGASSTGAGTVLQEKTEQNKTLNIKVFAKGILFIY